MGANVHYETNMTQPLKFASYKHPAKGDSHARLWKVNGKFGLSARVED